VIAIVKKAREVGSDGDAKVTKAEFIGILDEVDDVLGKIKEFLA